MKKLTKSQVTRQDIFRRAHELRGMNGRSVHARPFGFWLKMAWDEARDGRTQNWLWLSDDNMLAWLSRNMQAAMAEGDYRLYDDLRAREKAVLARQAPALQLAA